VRGDLPAQRLPCGRLAGHFCHGPGPVTCLHQAHGILQVFSQETRGRGQPAEALGDSDIGRELAAEFEYCRLTRPL
jgi:hypothetical protein